MSYYRKWISPGLCAKIKCQTNGVSGDNSKWNLCFRGPKVRVNGSLWSLGNLIQEAGLITSVLTGRQPVPFLFPPFLLSLLLVLSPHFNFFFFLWCPFFCHVSIPFFFDFFGTSSPVFFSPPSSPLSRWCHIHCPTFFWHSMKTHSGTCDHTHTWTFCFCLSISPSVSFSLFVCLSLCPPFSSDREERSRSVSDEGVQAGRIRRVCFVSVFICQLSHFKSITCVIKKLSSFTKWILNYCHRNPFKKARFPINMFYKLSNWLLWKKAIIKTGCYSLNA